MCLPMCQFKEDSYYPGLKRPVYYNMDDLIYFNVSDVFTVSILKKKPNIYFLPLELWEKIFKYKFSLEEKDWDDWIYSDDNCLTKRRYSLRKKHNQKCCEYNMFYATTPSLLTNNYASVMMNCFVKIINNYNCFLCNGKKNYSVALENILNYLKDYNWWCRDIPDKYSKLQIAYNTFVNKIYENYNKYLIGTVTYCCEKHKCKINKIILDSHYFVNGYSDCEKYDYNCAVCYNFHDYIYHFDYWKLDTRVLRNGKIIYLKDKMYHNEWLQKEELL